MAKKFDIRDRLGYRVQNLANKMILWGARNYAKKFDAGVQEWRCLTILARSGSGTARDICEFTMMDKGNVSRAIKKLVAEGRVKEKPDRQDKRSTVLILTPKGNDLYQRIKQESDAREKKFLASLTAAERKALPNILTKLDGVIEDLLHELGEA
ncbi:MAG: MarR family transcriptional regulator [Rhodospirillaceae bacterium]|jgi:DNA-binding MarR family transcriptional regulator|nr:MarR family transcriptional regulator [Rhodospirillaceae bacterium]MBT7954654.1 MarR family transcriptional regulator [Rhodospirillaceae bacterium]